jgi:hypothetical protein
MIVVNVDVYGVGLVRSLRTVFPTTDVIALSTDPATRATATKAGASALPASSSSARLLSLIGTRLGRSNP